MAFLRALAWIFLIAAAIVLAADLTRATTGGALAYTSALTHWKTMAPQTLAATIWFIQQKLYAGLWDPFMVRILLLPTWLLLGSIGLALALLSRRKRRVNIYAN